ncbi:MAG: alpha/beta hydrolase [Chloroflexi bacterium]|nr:alpha/beta hydrolase [Chloroflexota bacterium]
MRIVLGHGASGTAASMKPHVDGLRRRGVDALAIDLPKGRAERAVDAYERAASPSPQDVIGGQSYGGRVASMLAARQPVAGLLLLSYPLHPPGKKDWEERVRHWPEIHCPVLLLSGEADPLARMEFLQRAVGRLENAELVTYPRLGHTLKPVLEDVLDRAAAWALGIARGS